MLQHCLGKVRAEQVQRIDVDFRIEPSLDAVIGRAAHIRFIRDHVFLKILANLVHDLL
jgi:hypothetical protein